MPAYSDPSAGSLPELNPETVRTVAIGSVRELDIYLAVAEEVSIPSTYFLHIGPPHNMRRYRIESLEVSGLELVVRVDSPVSDTLRISRSLAADSTLTYHHPGQSDPVAWCSVADFNVQYFSTSPTTMKLSHLMEALPARLLDGLAEICAAVPGYRLDDPSINIHSRGARALEILKLFRREFEHFLDYRIGKTYNAPRTYLTSIRRLNHLVASLEGEQGGQLTVEQSLRHARKLHDAVVDLLHGVSDYHF